jgi:hypothetical protein
MATAVAPPATPKTTTSVDPLYTQALAQAKASLAAQTAPIAAEQTASDAQFKGREADATGAAAALKKLLGGIGPAVNGEYQTGAQNVELAANGFSQGMQDAIQGNTDNLNSMLQKLGSPAQLESHAGEAKDVVYGMGGYNPGTTFSKQGAALGAAADLQAGAAALKGQENVKSLQAQSIVADQGFQSKIAELAGKLPGDAQTNYQHLQQIALDDAKFREQVRQDKIDAAYKQADLKLSEAKYSTSVAEFNAKQKLSQAQFSAKQGLAESKYATSVSEFNSKQQLSYAKLMQQQNIASAKLAQSQFKENRDYGIKLANLGIAKGKLQQTILANSFKAANGGLTKVQVGKYTSQAQAIAMKSYFGSTKVTTVAGVPQSTANVGNVTYSEALSRILDKGIPVQIALDSLDRVYPSDQRPTDEILSKVLGPLAPALMKSVAQEQAAVGVAGAAMTDSMHFPSQRTLNGQQLNQLAVQALKIAAPQMATRSNVQALVGRIMQESGGNPLAINNWDSNAKAGTPSKGILQTIEPTFTAHALPGHTNIWNPLDNAIAAVRYMVSRYGRIVGPSGSGY